MSSSALWFVIGNGLTCNVFFGVIQASDKSDVDILVRFDRAINWERYFGAQFYLEDVFGGRSVDLVIENDLRPEVRPYEEREVLNV